MQSLGIEETPTLIVGGGLVGLAAGLFLHHRRTPFILIERNRAASPLPRARGIAARTMELFRQVGMQAQVEAAGRSAWEVGVFGGGRRGRTMLSSEALTIPDEGKHLKGGDPSPCEMTACPSTLVEPVLRRALEERGGDVRFGWELLRFEQDGGRVSAIVRDPAGAERTILASYLLAADGSRGNTRRHLGIGRQGSDADQHFLNVFFESDLAARVEGRTFSQCEVANGTVSGLFLSMNNTTRWSFHLLHDPATGQPGQWSEGQLTHLLGSAIGADVPLALCHSSAWDTRVRVADRYRNGRVFLMGDAAHAMPPWGGFNANTGIADAHNLAWKLASVLDGTAHPALLDSYETERRPVALRNGEQSRLRTDFDARFGIRTDANTTAFDRMLDGGDLLMRYRYGRDDTVAALRTQPGTRFPHAWIERQGQRCSILDLFGSSFVSIGGPSASSLDTGNVYRAGVDFRFVDEAVTWHSLTGRTDEDLVPIRPDGIIAIHG